MPNRQAGFRPFPASFLITSCIGAVMLLQAPASTAVDRDALGAVTRVDPGASGDAIDPVQRFLARVDEPLVQYRARRTLRARNERFNKEGWITARTELAPGTGFTYRILEEGGSGYIRSRVLLKALDGEREAVVAGEPARAALSPANYRFSATPSPRAPSATPGQGDRPSIESPGVDAPSITTVRIIPLRKDKLLVDGTITVTAADGDLLRIEGRLVKNPSFWTSRVEIVRRYGRIDGIRVPLAIESTANVKIAGTSVFSMTYDYESINGRPVSAAAQAAATRALQ